MASFDGETGIHRNIADVAETLERAKQRGKTCALLIGAGCSVKAGIPTAAQLVEIIRDQYPRSYERANPKDYPNCMAELAPEERRDLVASYVDRARVNWAHVCIAQLLSAGFVDRVLTTNFDMLVARGCALFGEFPAVYDFAASQMFNPAFVPDRAIFYLHGQRHGFVLLNTPEDVTKHAQLLRPVFSDAGRGRVWLVVGYSGLNDPVFEHLAEVPRFDNKLYWVGYGDDKPSSQVRDRILVPGKYAFFVSGHDADDFFVQLCQALGRFPPSFVSKPFSYLDSIVQTLAPYPIPGSEHSLDVTAQSRELIRQAIREHEEYARRIDVSTGAPRVQADVLALQQALMAGDVHRVIRMHQATGGPLGGEGASTIAWAYIGRGNATAEAAKSRSGATADDLFRQAIEDFEQAQAVDPAKYQALTSWGDALAAQAAMRVDGAEAKSLLRLAARKHEAALRIAPDDPWTLNSLGNVLVAEACISGGDESEQLFGRAVEQYEAALAIDPAKHEVLNSWGTALLRWARRKGGTEAADLAAEAELKFRDALRIRPDDHWSMNNLADALLQRARLTEGDIADGIFQQALATYQAAVQTKAATHISLENWGNALSQRALRKGGPEADHLMSLAEEAYQAALDAKPDYFWALNSWGYALSQFARTKPPHDAQRLFAMAGERFAAALRFKPDDHWALHNWGCALVEEARFNTGLEGERLFALAVEKFSQAVHLDPHDCWAWHHWGNALAWYASTKPPHQASRLVAEAKANFLRAEEIYPGCSTYELARTCALLRLESACRDWLERCARFGRLPARDVLVEDAAFHDYRDAAWFQTLFAGPSA
jgi:tetratricopeptide (TPR) repeat protein